MSVFDNLGTKGSTFKKKNQENVQQENTAQNTPGSESKSEFLSKSEVLELLYQLEDKWGHRIDDSDEALAGVAKIVYGMLDGDA